MSISADEDAGLRQSFPSDAVTAVTHMQPYPYYSHLVANKPYFRDEELAVWVASGSSAVMEVLANPSCRVRPPAEPVPKAILGSPAEQIFRHLIRMNDGSAHCPLNQAVAATLAAIVKSRLRAESATSAASLLAEFGPRADTERLNHFCFQFPVHVVSTLLGVPSDRMESTVAWLDAYVRCVAPGATPAAIDHGKAGAGLLLDLFRTLLGAATDSDGTLLSALAREARRVGRGDDSLIIANSIGFLSQAYEATAGLIGNTLVLLARRPDIRTQLAADPSMLGAIVGEVVRYDPSVHNTRRFVAEDCIIAGQAMKRGETILVVLAAANRDPAVNPDPNRFDPTRRDRKTFTFGDATHACPGALVAATIAEAAIEQLLLSDLDFHHLADAVTYRPSANVRIPRFGRTVQP